MQVYTWEGAIYEGQVVDGKRHGYGTMKFAGSPQVYQGNWQDGQRHGRGILYFNQDMTAYYDGMRCIQTIQSSAAAKPALSLCVRTMITSKALFPYSKPAVVIPLHALGPGLWKTFLKDGLPTT